ncbi:RsfA family transcriptional regulator [Metabacillus arenae]|uniref:RsfA family transcriptional regulator n=1 Tax=Metabacillus arenae TaxID=2771434 RepID=A0A926NGR1_9BACI|nr:RsfA family transcriptional regulator [Metabacillus arenae]MBD1379718.1 RsfA family transcriptional regulator [Metabacillus arenae]
MKQRQDAWSEENDLLLAETVLRHVREGSTQLNAFEEVGDKLNRTSAACGFRWNAVVRHNYEKALQLAKKQRKQRMRAMGTGQPAKKKLLYSPPETGLVIDHELEDLEMPIAEAYEQPEREVPVSQHEINEPVGQVVKETVMPNPQIEQSELTLEKVINFLKSYKGNTTHISVLSQENSRIKRENEELMKRNKELEKQVTKLEEQTVTVQEDYETLMKIMNRARKLVLFEEEDRSATSFKMDRNGNLEKLAE